MKLPDKHYKSNLTSQKESKVSKKVENKKLKIPNI